VPDGLFVLISSFLKLKEFALLFAAFHFNKDIEYHCERRLQEYAHHTKPLFDMFASKEALKWVICDTAIKMEKVNFVMRLGRPSYTADDPDTDCRGRAEFG